LLERLFPYLTETLESLLRHRTSSLCSFLPLIFIPAPKIINSETMASSPPDQAAILKEVLDAVKTLQVNQVQLSSAVDAISGRVNVLAGMKEVRDIAIAIDSPSPHPVKKIDSIQNITDDSHSDDVVPPSPSLPASAFSSSPGTSSPLSHARKPSVTSRIILT
jgi:hypothetical protein